MEDDFEFTDIVQAFDPKHPTNIKASTDCTKQKNECHKKKKPKIKMETLSATSIKPSVKIKYTRRDFSATNELLDRLKKRENEKMNELTKLIMVKTKNDPFGINPNKEAVTLLCPWCGEKKGYSIMSRHLYTKCNNKPIHIQQANAANTGRFTRSSRSTRSNVNYKAFMNNVDDGDNRNDNVDAQIANQAETNTNNYKRNNSKGTRTRNTRVTRRKPQPSDDEDYAPSNARRTRSSKRKR